MLTDERDFQTLSITQALFCEDLECKNFLPDRWWDPVRLIVAWELWKARNQLMFEDQAATSIETAFRAWHMLKIHLTADWFARIPAARQEV